MEWRFLLRVHRTRMHFPLPSRLDRLKPRALLEERASQEAVFRHTCVLAPFCGGMNADGESP